jgi:site-specific DNA-methyltransferase (adenine-specific)
MINNGLNIGDSILINDDCFNVFGDIEDKSIDAIIADLPYGTSKNKDDIALPLDKLWKEYKRIIKDNGVIILFAQGLFYIDLVNSNRKMFRYDLVWDKKLTTGFLNAKKMPLRSHENIAIFYKKPPTYNPQFIIGEPLHSKGKNYLSKAVKNQNYGEFKPTNDDRAGIREKYPKSILSFNKPHPSIAMHRTEKSIELLMWLVKTYTNECDIVMDNTMGSGTTGIACSLTGRKFIGIEINEDYFNITVDRLKKIKI